MAVDSKFFNTPFGSTGDRVTIPEATQPSGAVSYQQGFGPDYERDPATDPLAKRVPRDETNEYLYQISNAVKYLQWYGLPQYTSVADGGPANYPLTARVRYDAGAGMQAWVSIVAANTAVPGSDATKWALDDAFNLATLEATLAEALAGTLGAKIITPRRLASSVQRGQWNYAAGSGTANALTVSLSPALAAYSNGTAVRVIPTATNTGASTINVNGLGAVPVLRSNGAALQAGDLLAGVPAEMSYYSGSFFITGTAQIGVRNILTFDTVGTTNWTVPPEITKARVICIGGGGSAGYAQNLPGGGGGSGGRSTKWCDVTPGQIIPITVGAGGAAAAAYNNGTTGGTSQFGSYCSASGGLGGGGGTAGGPAAAPGGAGGTGTGGDLNERGSYGGDGISVTLSGGFGGGPGNGRGATGFNTGISATSYGGGGGGGGSNNTTSGGASGGAGFKGCVIVEF